MAARPRRSKGEESPPVSGVEILCDSRGNLALLIGRACYKLKGPHRRTARPHMYKSTWGVKNLSDPGGEAMIWGRMGGFGWAGAKISAGVSPQRSRPAISRKSNCSVDRPRSRIGPDRRTPCLLRRADVAPRGATRPGASCISTCCIRTRSRFGGGAPSGLAISRRVIRCASDASAYAQQKPAHLPGPATLPRPRPNVARPSRTSTKGNGP